MAPYKIEVDIGHSLRVHMHDGGHILNEGFRRNGFVGKQLQDVGGEGIIHDRIELIAPQPCHGIMPYFSEDIQVRLDGFHGMAEVPGRRWPYLR